MLRWRFFLSIFSLFPAKALLEDAGPALARSDRGEHMSQPTVYVLKCKDGAFYVGYSANFDARMEEHASELGGSEWTREHTPLEVVERHVVASEDEGKALEKRLTLQRMMEYGVNKVRGAGYTHTRAYASSGLEAIVRSYAEVYDEDIATVRDRFEGAMALHYPDEFESDTEFKAASLPEESGEDEGYEAGDACVSGGDAEASDRSYSDNEEIHPREVEAEASKDETSWGTMSALPSDAADAGPEAEAAADDDGDAFHHTDDADDVEASGDVVLEQDYVIDDGGGYDGGYDGGDFDDGSGWGGYDNGGYECGGYDDEY